MQASASLPSAPSLTPDFEVENHGTIFLLHHRTPAARAWVREHLPADRQTWGDATIVEPRCIRDIVSGAQADGLVVA
jgi:hypothetical protein